MEKYDGDWSEGFQNGEGTVYYSDGKTIKGEFLKNFFHGHAKLFGKDGKKVLKEGTFQGKPHLYFIKEEVDNLGKMSESEFTGCGPLYFAGKFMSHLL